MVAMKATSFGSKPRQAVPAFVGEERRLGKKFLTPRIAPALAGVSRKRRPGWDGAWLRWSSGTLDVRNRLSEVTTRATAGGPATSIVDYLYDAENRWIGENIDSTGDGQIDQEIRFAYDGDQIVLEFDKDLSGGSSSAMTASDLSHRYLWGPTVDQLLADEQLPPLPPREGQGEGGQGSGGQTTGYDLTQPGTVVWALTDNQNTVRDLGVYNAQTGVTSIANHRVYDSFGNLLSQTNPATGNAAAVDCLFGYTGFAWDHGSGTWRSDTRPYNPTTGRWIQKDKIVFDGGDTNLDRYCGNSPMNAVDSTGEWVYLATAVGETAVRLAPAEGDGFRASLDISFSGNSNAFNAMGINILNARLEFVQIAKTTLNASTLLGGPTIYFGPPLNTWHVDPQNGPTFPFYPLVRGARGLRMMTDAPGSIFTAQSL